MANATPERPPGDFAMTISAAYRAPEPDLLPPLMRAAGVDPATRQRIVARAGTLVAAMQKAATSAGGLAQFLNEYRISTTEGVVQIGRASCRESVCPSV